MTKKISTIAALSAAIVLLFSGCGDPVPAPAEPAPVTERDVSVCLLLSGNEDSRDGEELLTACRECGLSDEEITVRYEMTDENAICDAACEAGTTLVLADAPAAKAGLQKAAAVCPDTQFCYVSQTPVEPGKRENFHAAVAAVNDGRYLAGVMTGVKLQWFVKREKIKANEVNIGYVGTVESDEVTAAYTAFYSGVRSVCPTAKLTVRYAGIENDDDAERDAANALINGHCVLVASHSSLLGAPVACEARNILCVPFNIAPVIDCPNTYLTAAKVTWVPYLTYAITALKQGKSLDAVWAGTVSNGTVDLCDANRRSAPPQYEAAITAAKEQLKKGYTPVTDGMKA